MKFLRNLKLGMISLLAAFPMLVESDEIPNLLQQNLHKLNPELAITKISATPVSGIIEVEIGGSQIVYASNKGTHIFTGDLIDITDGINENLTEKSQQEIRRRVLTTLRPDTFITYHATPEETSQIYVFTDTSCSYCQNFHKQIQAINSTGITVHYLAFPRTGPDSANARMMARAWCSDDPQASLTALKANGTIPAPPSCQAPIESHFQAGSAMGVSGTPYILTQDGRKLGGFLSIEDLVSALQ